MFKQRSLCCLCCTRLVCPRQLNSLGEGMVRRKKVRTIRSGRGWAPQNKPLDNPMRGFPRGWICCRQLRELEPSLLTWPATHRKSQAGPLGGWGWRVSLSAVLVPIGATHRAWGLWRFGGSDNRGLGKGCSKGKTFIWEHKYSDYGWCFLTALDNESFLEAVRTLGPWMNPRTVLKFLS